MDTVKFEERNKVTDSNFQWKMIIHILLVIFTTIQVVLIVCDTTRFTRSQERILYNLFLENSDKRDLDFQRNLYLYTFDEIRNHLTTSIQNFYDLQSKSFEIIKYNDDNKLVNMEVLYMDYKSILNTLIPKNEKFEVSNTTLGPFDYQNDEVKLFFNDVISFNLNFTFKTYVPSIDYDNYFCFNWNLIQNYDFTNRAHFIVSLDINRQDCQDILGNDLTYFDRYFNDLKWIPLIVILLALISMYYSVLYISKIAKLYGKIRAEYHKKDKNSKELSDSDDSNYYNPLLDKDFEKKTNENPQKKNLEVNQEKKRLFNSWSVISLIANIVQILGSLIYLINDELGALKIELLFGFGCLLAYINILSYIDSNPNYSIITSTLKRSFPNVIKYLIGVSPIFIGFIFLGLCIFWRSDRFSDTSTTMISLFSLMNGDSVYDIFSNVTSISFFLGQIYLYSFNILFMIVFMNVFISILEEAYITIKMTNKNHWVYAYLKLDKEKTLENNEKEDDKIINQFKKDTNYNSLSPEKDYFNNNNNDLLSNNHDFKLKSIMKPVNEEKQKLIIFMDPKKKVEFLLKNSQEKFEMIYKLSKELDNDMRDFEEKNDLLELLNSLEKKITNIKNSLLTEI